MISSPRLLALGVLLSLSAPLLSQNCGCSQCDIPIVANYDRAFYLDVYNATFNNLGTPAQGVCEVEIDFAHDFLSDLQVSLTSPSGQTVQLVRDASPNDATYFSRWKIKFKPCGQAAVPDAGFLPNFDDNTDWPKSATLTGSYYPSTGCLENFDLGSVNGRWTLQVNSAGFRGVGFIYGFKINFCQNQGVQCTGLTYETTAGEDCSTAAPLPPNIDTYIGNTAPFAPGFASDFCGGLHNDQWFTFVSSCDTVVFTITSGYCINGDGVQIALYDECFGSAPIACAEGSDDCGWCSWTIVAPTTPGQQYYLVIDGWLGDQCDFEFTIPPGCFAGLADPEPNDFFLNGCQGTSQGLAIAQIPFGAAGYIWKATNGALVNGQTQVTVPGPENLNVEITFGSDSGQVCVAAYNFTDTTDFFCFEFTVDTNLFFTVDTTICYDDFPYYSEYEAYGVPPLGAPGTYTFMLQDYLDENGALYPCPVKLEIHLESEGGFSPLPSVIALGGQYVLPTGEVVTSSGPFFWSDTLTSGCTLDHVQGIYLIDWLYDGNGCAPDTVTFILPGSGVTLECPGGTPAAIGGTGAKKVVYQNSGVYDFIGKIGNQTFVFEDTLVLNLTASPMANFTTSVAQNVLTVNNFSQNATSFLWNFGDGTTSTEANPMHTYAAPGNYTVTLTAFGPCPASTFSKIVTIGGQLPQAAFQVSDPVGCAPFVVQYTDQSIGSPTAWLWDFPGGDPATSTAENPIVTYNAAGTYSATLSIENVFGQNTVVQNAVVTVHPPTEAIFSIVISQNQITLENLSQNATGYFWDFGDGFNSTEASPSHTYAAPGEYTVTFVASGICGISTITQTVSIEGQAPQAQFQVSQNEGCVPLIVQYQDQSAGNPTAWAWQFPGGIPSTSTAQNPSVTYINAGTFDVTLTVQNLFGESTLAQTAIVSASPLPTVSFSFSEDALQVVFSNQSQNADAYLWDFGDSTISAEAAPTHTYAAQGSYLVTLQATNTCGTSILQQWVTVMASGTVAPSEIAWLRVSPNPSDGHFQLELRDEPSPQLAWRLFNSLGQCLAQRDLGAFDGYYMEKMDFGQLPPAVYWLEVRTAEKGSWVRVVMD
ncbi:MAG: PKD domain-containing protein [Saprospiraceae bacterium]